MPIDVSKLKPGNYVVIDGEPCKVGNIVKSKPGKHGSTKARIEAVGMFDGKKRIILKPTSATIETPDIDKRRAQVVAVTGETAQLMDMEDYSTFESSIPEEFRGRLEVGKEVVYWKIGGRMMIREVK